MNNKIYCTYVDIQKFNIKYLVQGADAYRCSKLVRLWFVRLYADPRGVSSRTDTQTIL